MNRWLLRTVSSLVLMAVCLPTVAAQTPAAVEDRDGWWTAWSCEISPVHEGPAPASISGMPDELVWLQGEPTNDSDIEMIVWLWTGNRPLPLDGMYGDSGMSTKWLWAFSDPMTDIAATVTSDTGATGEVQFGGQILGSSTGPINGWPSYAVVPEPGCWTFAITATAKTGELYEGQVVFPAVP